MTQVQKLSQAAGLIRQATEVYEQAIAELTELTGKDYNHALTTMGIKVEDLLDLYARVIGECVLNET